MPNVAALQAFMNGLMTGSQATTAILDRKAREAEAERQREFSMSLEKMGLSSRERQAELDRTARWNEALLTSDDRMRIATMDEEGRNRRFQLEAKIRERGLDQDLMTQLAQLGLATDKFGYEQRMGEAANARAEKTTDSQLQNDEVTRRAAEQRMTQLDTLFGTQKTAAELANVETQQRIDEQKRTADDRAKLLAEQVKGAAQANQQGAELFPIQKEGAQADVAAKQGAEKRASEMFPFQIESAKTGVEQGKAGLDLTRLSIEEKAQLFRQNAARFKWEQDLQPLKKEMAQIEVESQRQAAAISAEKFAEWKSSKMKPEEGVAFLEGLGIEKKRAEQLVAGKTWSRDTLVDAASKVIGIEKQQMEREALQFQGQRLESDLKTADLQRQIAADRHLIDMEKADYERMVLNPAQLRIMDLKERGLTLEVEKAEQELKINQKLRMQGGTLKALAAKVGMPADFVDSLHELDGGLTLSQYSTIFNQLMQMNQLEMTSQQLDAAAKAQQVDTSMKIMRTNVETIGRLKADVEGEIGEREIFAMLAQAHQQQTQMKRAGWEAKMDVAKQNGDVEQLAALAAQEPQVSVPTLAEVQGTLIEAIRPRLEARLAGKSGLQYQIIGPDGTPGPIDMERVLADLAVKYTSERVTFNQESGKFERIQPPPREGSAPVSSTDMTIIAKDPRFQRMILNAPRDQRDEVAKFARAVVSVPTQFDDAIGIKTHEIMGTAEPTSSFSAAWGTERQVKKNTPLKEGMPTDRDFKPVWESWREITRGEGAEGAATIKLAAQARWAHHMAIHDDQPVQKSAFGKRLTIPSTWEEARTNPDVMRYLLVDAALAKGAERSYAEVVKWNPAYRNWHSFTIAAKRERESGARFRMFDADLGKQYENLPHKRLERWIAENWE